MHMPEHALLDPRRLQGRCPMQQCSQDDDAYFKCHDLHFQATHDEESQGMVHYEICEYYQSTSMSQPKVLQNLTVWFLHRMLQKICTTC